MGRSVIACRRNDFALLVTVILHRNSPPFGALSRFWIKRSLNKMPWTPNDAERHTHKATTLALKELWAKVANESLERTGDEGRAIREANAVVARQKEPSYRK